ncbi:MAG: hypothetical protein LLF76_03095 [Planctomycetaceae bacterium]|nr:hypothetical protein [Planctomycetaceae bacterium]
MSNQDAKTAYAAARKDIANLLGFFECEMGKDRQDVNWAHVGDMNRVRQGLIETLSVLSGFETSAIKETLEETRIDADVYQNA